MRKLDLVVKITQVIANIIIVIVGLLILSI